MRSFTDNYTSGGYMNSLHSCKYNYFKGLTLKNNQKVEARVKFIIIYEERGNVLFMVLDGI